MCKKRSKEFGASSARIGLLLVFLLAVLSPLAAWPTWIGGSAEMNAQISQKEDIIQLKESEIESLNFYIDQLEIDLRELTIALSRSENSLKNQDLELIELKSLEQELNKELTESRAQLMEAEKTISSLKTELNGLKENSELSEESYGALANEQETVLKTLSEKSDESAEYYQELVKQKSKNASLISGMLGGSAIFDPTTGEFGAEVTAGVGIGFVMFTAGAQYMFTGNPIDPADLVYKAGLQLKF